MTEKRAKVPALNWRPTPCGDVKRGRWSVVRTVTTGVFVVCLDGFVYHRKTGHCDRLEFASVEEAKRWVDRKMGRTAKRRKKDTT